MEKFIRFEISEGVAQITLNRPDVLNSFHREMAKEVQQAFANIQNNDEVRTVVLTGEGRAFCAGQDLAEATSGETLPDLGDIVKDTYNPIIKAIRYTEKPVICAVNGVAAGAGANIALACDIVIASEKAKFIQAFCKIGVIPDSGGTFFLPRLVGLPRATAMMMLGEPITAQQAVEIGMIYKVCPPETVLSQALELAKHLATQPTRALGLTKRALNQSFANNLDAQLDTEEELQRLVGQTQDYQEGVKSFLEKRPAKFIGK